MNLKDFIFKLFKEGKTVDEIKTALVDFDGEFTADEVKGVLDDYAAKQQRQVELDKLNQKETPAADTKEADQKIEALNTKLDKALEQIAAAQPKKPAYEYKSFLREFQVIQDHQWRKDMLKMLIAEKHKDYSTANELSDRFLANAKLLRGDAVSGSYAVPEEFSDLVFSVAQRGSNIWANATKMVQAVGDKMYLLGSGDVTFTEVADQSTALTASEPVLTQNSIDLIDSGAVSYLHKNLISDSNVAMVTVLANAYARGLQKYLKRATTVQNVTTTGDKLDGIYSISGIGSVAVADGGGVIAVSDIINLVYAVDESFRDGCVFELNDQELKQLQNLDYAGSGREMPLLDMKEKTILGYKYFHNNQMPATMVPGTGARTGGTEATMLFGAPSEVQITFKGGLMFESSEHYKFIDDQTTFKGKIRWGMDVVNASAWSRLTNVTRA